jgi:hypothetical protein
MERAWLEDAGFTRRNTRRAILRFIRTGVWPEERIHVLRSGVYLLQMGFIAVTNRRVVLGMSWAFVPFINSRRDLQHSQLWRAVPDWRPWGARLTLHARERRLRLGNLEREEAAALARQVQRLAVRAQPPAGPSWGRVPADVSAPEARSPMTETPTPGPGFYPDPNDPNVERYWDGQKWTESRQPIGRRPGEKEQEANGVIIAGYVLAVLIPLVGFILGLTQINRNRHGLWVVILSVVAFAVWYAIVMSSSDTTI